MSLSSSRVLIAALAFAVALVGCTDTKSIDTPIPAGKLSGKIELNPVFSPSAHTIAASLADFGLTFDRVRITIRNNPDTTVVVSDTTVTFGPTSNSLTLDLAVPVDTIGEVFNARVQYVGASGVVFAGSVLVKSHAPGVAAPEQPPLVLNFVGPGASVKTITVSPDPVLLLGATTAPLTITATDSSGAAITVPPLAFTSSDATIATIATTASGRVVQSFGKRGTALLTATTPTGISDTLSALVTLPAASIVLLSGGDQTGTVGTALASTAVVQVNASDGVGVSGVPVTFAAPIGGSVGTTSATTDANGRASTTMTLATTAGTQSFVATAAGLNVPIPATALAGTASAAPSVITSSIGSIKADNLTPATITVQAKDQFGNALITGGAAVKLTTSLGHFGTSGAATTVDATDLGDGNYSAQLFSLLPGTATITGTLGGAPIATPAATVSVSALPAAAIVLLSGGGQNGTVGATLSTPAVVQVKSAEGIPLPGVTVTFNAPTGASVGTATATTDANGRASTTLTLATLAGAQSFSATAAGFSVAIPETGVAGAASAATSTITSSVAQINADNITPAVITVHAKDQFGNVIGTGGANVMLTTTLGHWSGGLATTTTAADAGNGTYTATLLSAASGTVTITGTVGGTAIATPAVTINAIATVLDHFDVTLADGTTITGNLPAGVTTSVRIRALDASSHVVAGYTSATTLSITNSTFADGTHTGLTPVAGVVTTTVKFGIIGSNVTLDASGATKIGHSAAFSVVAGAPAAIVSSDTTLVYPAGPPPNRYPVIHVFDVVGNGVGAQPVSFTVTAPCTLATSQVTTDSQGAITFSATSLTVPITGTSSPFSCRLVGSPVGFAVPSVPIALIVQPAGGTAWTGRLDNTWETGNNWTANVPSPTSAAFVGASQSRATPFYPLLGSNPAIGSIDVEDGAQLNLNAHTLNVSQSIDARTSGAIMNGTISVPVGANGGSMRGMLPSVNCQSGVYTLTGLTQLSGGLTLSNCAVDVGAQNLSVAQSLSTGPGAGLRMNQATGRAQISGSATFGGGANQLTAGTLTVLGDFTQSGTGTFAPTGTHLVNIGGQNAQNPIVRFEDVSTSGFQNLNVALVLGQTVVINSAVKVAGTFTVNSTTGGTLSLTSGLANTLNGPISVTGSLAINLGGVINTSSLSFANGTVTLTGGGQLFLPNGVLHLGDDGNTLHLVVNVMGTFVGAVPAGCTHGGHVTIDGTNGTAIQALKLACGIP